MLAAGVSFSGPPAEPASGFSRPPRYIACDKVLMKDLDTEQVIDTGIQLYLRCGSGFGCLVQLEQRGNTGMVQYTGVGYC